MGFNDTWSEATTDGAADGNPPPDGPHDVALIDAGAFTSKAGNDIAKLEFRSVTGDHQWSSILGFKNSRQAGVTKAACQKIGVNVDEVGSIKELDAALKRAVGGFYEVEVKRRSSNGGEPFVNTYINDGVTPAQPDVPADTNGFETAEAGSQFGEDPGW